ncbi:MAG: hypothetical protein R3F33_14405 [Planctomycetota bacterium]
MTRVSIISAALLLVSTSAWSLSQVQETKPAAPAKVASPAAPATPARGLVRLAAPSTAPVDPAEPATVAVLVTDGWTQSKPAQTGDDTEELRRIVRELKERNAELEKKLKEAKKQASAAPRAGKARGRSQQEAEEQVLEAHARAAEERAKADEIRAKAEITRKEAEEIRARAEGIRARAAETRGQAERIRVQADRTRQQSDEFRARAEAERAEAEALREQARQVRVHIKRIDELRREMDNAREKVKHSEQALDRMRKEAGRASEDEREAQEKRFDRMERTLDRNRRNLHRAEERFHDAQNDAAHEGDFEGHTTNVFFGDLGEVHPEGAWTEAIPGGEGIFELNVNGMPEGFTWQAFEGDGGESTWKVDFEEMPEGFVWSAIATDDQDDGEAEEEHHVNVKDFVLHGKTDGPGVHPRVIHLRTDGAPNHGQLIEILEDRLGHGDSAEDALHKLNITLDADLDVDAILPHGSIEVMLKDLAMEGLDEIPAIAIAELGSILDGDEIEIAVREGLAEALQGIEGQLLTIDGPVRITRGKQVIAPKRAKKAKGCDCDCPDCTSGHCPSGIPMPPAPGMPPMVHDLALPLHFGAPGGPGGIQIHTEGGDVYLYYGAGPGMGMPGNPFGAMGIDCPPVCEEDCIIECEVECAEECDDACGTECKEPCSEDEAKQMKIEFRIESEESDDAVDPFGWNTQPGGSSAAPASALQLAGGMAPVDQAELQRLLVEMTAEVAALRGQVETLRSAVREQQSNHNH